MFERLLCSSAASVEADAREAETFAAALAFARDPSQWAALSALPPHAFPAEEAIAAAAEAAAAAFADDGHSDDDDIGAVAGLFEAGSEAVRARLVLRDLMRIVAEWHGGRREPDVSSATAAGSCRRCCSELLSDAAYARAMALRVPLVATRCEAVLPFRDLLCSLSLVGAVGAALALISTRPHRVAEAVDALFSLGDDCRYAAQCLTAVAALSGFAARLVRAEAVRRRKHPRLVLHATRAHIRDDASFVCALCCDPASAAWMRGFLDSSSSPQQQRNGSCNGSEVRDALLADVVGDSSCNDSLRALCGLHGVLGMPASAEELSSLLGDFAEKVSSQHHTLKLLLSVVVCCRDLLRVTSRDSVVQFFGTLLRSCDSHRDVLLLVAILLQTGQVQPLSEFVSSATGLPVSLNAESVLLLGELLRLEVFTEDALCKQAAALPELHEGVPKELQDNALGCVFFLLKSGAFTRSRVDIGKWIVRQMLVSSLPVHRHFPQLIGSFVDSILESIGHNNHQAQGPAFAFTGLAEPTIRKVLGLPRQPLRKNTGGIIPLPASCFFEHTGSLSRTELPGVPVIRDRSAGEEMDDLCQSFESASRFLVTLFVLEFNERGMRARAETRVPIPAHPQQRSEFLSRFSFPPDFLFEMPIRKIVSDAQSLPGCSALLESLVSLSASQFPHLFDPAAMLALEEEAFRQRNTAPLRFPHASADDRTLERFAQRWEEEYIHEPWEASMAAVNAFCTKGGRRITHIDVATDPALVLRVKDPQTLRTPALVQVILKALGCFNTAARKLLFEQTSQQEGMQEEISTLIVAQDSAIVQMLLELCLAEHPLLPAPRDQESLEAVRVRVCGFVHSMFLDAPLLAKLVHFQGYSLSLIPLMVRCVPSMHVCLEFIPELLAQPQLDKQLFAIHLAAHLAVRYRIPSGLSAARAVIERLRNFHFGSENASSFLCAALPPLALVCDAFDFLSEELSMLVEDLERNADPSFDSAVLAEVHSLKEKIYP